MTRKFTNTLWSAALVVAIGAATGCDYIDQKTPALADAPTGSATLPSAASPGTPATATFQQVFSQIIQPKCLGCHASGISPNLSSWASFAQDTRYVLPGNPGQSDLYIQVQNGNMPQGGGALTASQLQLLYDWIASGAQNN
jgi:hypothetical protein